MKMKNIAWLSTIVVTFLLTNNSFAQEPGMKTLPPVKITTTSTKVDQKVWDSFRKSFPEADDVKWYNADKNYMAKFIQDDQQNSALFNKKGYLLYSISYGFEKDLPENIRTQVHHAYPECTISRAIKVEQEDRTVWVVNVDTRGDLRVVRIEGDELEEVEKLKKAS